MGSDSSLFLYLVFGLLKLNSAAVLGRGVAGGRRDEFLGYPRMPARGSLHPRLLCCDRRLEPVREPCPPLPLQRGGLGVRGFRIGS